MCAPYRQMFEGSDLAYAYGDAQGHPYADLSGPAAQHRPQAPLMTAPAINAPIPPPAVSSTSHAMAPEVPYAPPQAMYGSQPAGAAPTQGDGLFDRMARKKGEVLKLVTLSLVILLGLALDRFVKHYVNNYITAAFLTDFQEFVVRLAYPTMVVCAIWMLRAM